MNLDLAQLHALAATVSAGTLDGAARALHVTPSAVSQRLKALETATGRVLLVRTKPVRVTASGRAVLRLARQVELLAADAAQELEVPAEGKVSLPIAVNADSLATWVLPALAPLSTEYCFDLYREDQAHTSVLLREGTVMAAITADAEPVPGCSSIRLGGMRYRPMCTPAFAARWFPGGVTNAELTTAPVVVFDRKDDLQHGYLSKRIGGPVSPPRHYVPASADFLAAVRLGLGWGMVPDLQRTDGRDDLIELDPAGVTDTVLYWQQWRLRSPSLDRVGQAVLAAARERLDQAAPEVRLPARR